MESLAREYGEPWLAPGPMQRGMLLMTMAISALGIRPAEMLSARASKFEPRPAQEYAYALVHKEKNV